MLPWIWWDYARTSIVSKDQPKPTVQRKCCNSWRKGYTVVFYWKIKFTSERKLRKPQRLNLSNRTNETCYGFLIAMVPLKLEPHFGRIFTSRSALPLSASEGKQKTKLKNTWYVLFSALTRRMVDGRKLQTFLKKIIKKNCATSLTPSAWWASGSAESTEKNLIFVQTVEAVKIRKW